MRSGQALRTARAARSTSQRGLARATGTHQPNIAAMESDAHSPTVSGLERYLRALDYRLTILPTRLRAAWETAGDIAAHLAVNDHSTAFREVIQLSDDFARTTPDIRVALSVTPPPLCGDPRYDALLAGVVDYWLAKTSSPRPGWLSEDSRRLDVHWVVEPLDELHDEARKATPDVILQHGVVLAESELQSV